MRLRLLLSATLLSLGLATSAQGATLQVTESGTFSSNTPTTMYTTPGGSFGISFLVDSSPTLKSFTAGGSFDPVIQNFQYTVNGSTVTPANQDIYFFNSSVGGGFNLCFAVSCRSATDFLSFLSPQVYTGTEASPTIQVGPFVYNGGGYDSNYAFARASDIKITAVTAVATTPEPSSFMLLSTGMLGLAGVLRRRRLA